VVGNPASLADYEQILGLPNDFSQAGFPAIGSNLIMPYGGSQWYYGMSQILTTLDQNFTKAYGKHQLAFGGRYRHERFGYLSDRSPDTVAFSNLATAVYDPTTGANYGAKPNTGYADADFFLGAADSYSENKNAPFNHIRDQEIDFYVQDNWRITPRLTLNLGLRWEMHPAPHADQGNLVTFDINHDALVLPNPISRIHDAGAGHQPAESRSQVRNTGAGRHSRLGLRWQYGQLRSSPRICLDAGIPLQMGNGDSRRLRRIYLSRAGPQFDPVPDRRLSVHRQLFAKLRERGLRSGWVAEPPAAHSTDCGRGTQQRQCD
jgi:hypothetical protein